MESSDEVLFRIRRLNAQRQQRFRDRREAELELLRHENRVLRDVVSGLGIDLSSVLPTTSQNPPPPEKREGGEGGVRSSGVLFGGDDPPEEKKEKKKRATQEPKFKPEDEALPEILNTPEFKQTWITWIQCRREQKKPLRPTGARQQIAKLARWAEEYGIKVAIETLELSTANEWQGLVPPEEQRRRKVHIATPTRSRESTAERIARVRAEQERNGTP